MWAGFGLLLNQKCRCSEASWCQGDSKVKRGAFIESRRLRICWVNEPMFAPVLLPSVLWGRGVPHGEFPECSVNVLRAAFIPPLGIPTAPQDLSGNRGPGSSRICSGPGAAVVLEGARLPGSWATRTLGPPEAGEGRSSSAEEAKPKDIASAQRITFHFNSTQILSTRVYCIPSIMARRGRGTYKTRLLPSGSLITSNLINHPDVEAAREFGGAKPRPAPTEPSKVWY